jgi:hypothetical protein
VAFEFRFQGGTHKPTEHTLEKFMLFFVVGGDEIPMYQMLRDGLVQRVELEGDRYVTQHNIAKLFIAQQGFGVQKRFHSFYVTLLDETAPDVQVLPFSLKKTGFFMNAKMRFLDKEAALALLAENSQSRSFVERQELLPVNLLREMVSVDRSHLKEGVRAVRIGSRKKS